MSRALIALAIVAAALFPAAVAIAAWSGPPGPPPSGNTPPPINTGSTAQTKSGILTAGQLFTAAAGATKAGNRANFDLGADILGADTAVYSYGRICAGNTFANCLGTGGVVISPLGITFPDGSTQTSAGGGGAGNGVTIGGTSTPGYLAEFTSSSALANSPVKDLGGAGISVNGTVEMGYSPEGGGDQFDIFNTTGKAYLYAYSTSNSSASVGAYSSTLGGINLLLNPSGGNVGIGTANPAAKLHVNGEFRADGSVRIGGLNNGIELTTTGIPSASAGNNIWNIRGVSDGANYLTPAGSLAIERWIGTVSAVRLTILSNGNVGIGGVTNPTQSFDVGGHVVTETAKSIDAASGLGGNLANGYDISGGNIGSYTTYAYDRICAGNGWGNCHGPGGTVLRSDGVQFPDGSVQSTAASSASLPIMGALHVNGTFDWNAGNWGVYSCDHGYTLLGYATMNSNVAGHNTATIGLAECVRTDVSGSYVSSPIVRTNY